jgi:hypothetical protein
LHKRRRSGQGEYGRKRKERGGYIRGAGFVSTIGSWSDLLGVERKWVKDRTEVMNSISIHEAKGRGKGKGRKRAER